VRTANRVAEEWYRQLVAWYHVGRGRVVLFDRHFYTDYYAHDIADDGAERSLSQRVHGYLLQHVYPRPGMVVLLDAPPEVLWARKAEGTFEALVRRREEYLRMRDAVPGMQVVDATLPMDQVVSRITALILERRGGGKPRA
jgi:thymidylate kinase